MSIEAAGYRFSHQPSSLASPLGGMRPFELRRTPIEFRALSAPQVFDDQSHLIHQGIVQGLGSVVEGVKTAFVSDREQKAAEAKAQRDHERALQIEGIKTSRSKTLNQQRLDAMRQAALDRINATGGDKTPRRFVDEDYSGGDLSDEELAEREGRDEEDPYEPFPGGERLPVLEPALPVDEEAADVQRELNDENTVPTQDQGIGEPFEPLPDLSPYLYEEQQGAGLAPTGSSLFADMDLSQIPPEYLSAQAGGAATPPVPEIPLSDSLGRLDMALESNPFQIDFVPPAAEKALQQARQDFRKVATRAAVQQEARALAGTQPVLAAMPQQQAAPAATTAPEAGKPPKLHPEFRSGNYRSQEKAMAAAALPVPEGYEQPEVEMKEDSKTGEVYYVVAPPKRMKKKEADAVAAGYDSESEKKLRTEYINLDQSKEFRTVQASYRNIVGSAKMSETGNPAAGDMSLIFSFMKLLDPNSVVRETEYANAAKAAGMPDRIVAGIQNVISGDILAPDTRKEFVRVAKSIFKQRQEAQNYLADQYRQLAKDSGLRPESVVINIQTPDPEGDLQDEFNKVASKAQALKNEGKQDTPEYRDLFNQLVEIRERQRKLGTE